MRECNTFKTVISLGMQSIFENGLDLAGVDLSGLVVKRLSVRIQDQHVRSIPVVVLPDDISLSRGHSNIKVNCNEMDRRAILAIQLNRASRLSFGINEIPRVSNVSCGVSRNSRVGKG